MSERQTSASPASVKKKSKGGALKKETKAFVPEPSKFVNVLESSQRVKSITEDEFLENEKLETSSLMESASFSLSFAQKEAKRRKFHFILAFCSVFLVVVSTLVIN